MNMYIQLIKKYKLLSLLIIFSVFMIGCSNNLIKSRKLSTKKQYRNLYTQQKDGSAALKDIPDLSLVKDPIPVYEPKSRYGNPATYKIFNKTYKVLSSSKGYTESGYASWYGTKFHGFRTSSGEIYDMYKMTAAHKTLPLPTYARVINLQNNRSIIVKINDRGPFHGNRILDLSYVAANKLGILKEGTGKIKIIAINPSTNTNLLTNNFLGNSNNNKKNSLQLGAFTVYANAKQLALELEDLLKKNNYLNSKNYVINIFSDSLQKSAKKNTLYKVILSSKKGELDLKYLNKILLNLPTQGAFVI